MSFHTPFKRRLVIKGWTSQGCASHSWASNREPEPISNGLGTPTESLGLLKSFQPQNAVPALSDSLITGWTDNTVRQVKLLDD